MGIFLTTVMLFAGFMAVHFAIWKSRLPKRQIRALMTIAAVIFFPWLAVSLARHSPPWTVLHIALFYWSVNLCYVVTYSAIEADSPTLSLMRFVGAGGSDGRSAVEITRFMDERPFMGARLAALVRSGLIREQEGRYVAGATEPLAFRLILGFRKLYGSIPKGG
jgi:hypothetical protein